MTTCTWTTCKLYFMVGVKYVAGVVFYSPVIGGSALGKEIFAGPSEAQRVFSSP